MSYLIHVRENAKVKIRGIRLVFEKLKNPLSHAMLQKLKKFEESLDRENNEEKIKMELDTILSEIRPLYLKLKKEEKLYAQQIKLERKLNESSDKCISCNSEIELSHLEKHPKTKLCINCYSTKNHKKFCCDCADEIPSQRVALNPSVIRCTDCQTEFENKRN